MAFQIPEDGSEQILADSADDTDGSMTWSAGNSVTVVHVDVLSEMVLCQIPERDNYVSVPLDGGLVGFEWQEDED